MEGWQRQADKIWATLDRVGEETKELARRHAQWELRHAQAELRMDRAEAESKARHARAEARMDRFDKQLIATRDLVRGGIKLVMEIGAAQRETKAEIKELVRSQRDTEAQIKELARSQRETDRMLKAFLTSMGKGPNGHKAA